MKHPEYQDKLFEEFDTAIVSEYLKERVAKGELQPGEEVKDIELLDLITFENGSDMKMYVNCFNEAIRIQPPIYFSSGVQMSESC